jgi:ribonuclease J
MTRGDEELVFAPLGGLGEIGMNAALYGYGRPGSRKWILVDLGLSFAGPQTPGVDLVFPDIAFAERLRSDLLGLFITHAHEDHVGAIADLWPRLNCPVYATRFAAGLLEARRLGEPGAPQIAITTAQPGELISIGPFSIEYVRMAHSIPESTALAIRTAAGTVLHTGDWKIDADPVVGWPTDAARLRAIGDEGVLALVCDSTNIMRAGESPSEADVARTLKDLVASARHRVVVTTFASNVARLRSVAEAALAAGRSVVVVGRAIARVVEVARECGYLDGLPDFLSADAYSNFDRDKIVVLATGSQGEARAALARVAQDDHPAIALASGDRVIFSSRTIPGNERAVNAIINALIDQGVEVITDRTHLVHVSGHPRRSEVARMYEWTRPKIAAPAHGEALHLFEHMRLARELGVERVLRVRDGDVLRLAPGEPSVVDRIEVGRLYKDGEILVAANDEAIAARRRLAFAGVVSVGLAITARGEIAGEPDVLFAGLPSRTREGRAMDEIIDQTLFATLDGLPRAKLRDPDAVAEALERAIRGVVRNVWGKRPLVHVLVTQI